ncbi:MAG TPA: NUDIX domain-containing protein [Candidatus Saccharimonadales bacterium]|nr:NUDIX domain-containing protein [Candidatus Saccharimonadales bacterium]
MPRVSARGIIIRDDELLLIERWRDGLHYFSVPGGGIEAGETPEQTVVRELAEETGCVVRPVRKLYFLTLADGNQSHIFLCNYVSGEAHLPPDAPEAQARPDNKFLPRWVPLSDLARAPFLVWEPVRKQLVHDMEHGFSESVRQLAC